MSTTTRSKRASSGPSSSGGSNRLVLVLVGIAVVAFVGVVAFLSAGETSDIPTLSDVAGPVSVDGAIIPVPYPDDEGTPDAAVGLPSPVITAIDYEDRPVTIGEPGRAQVLVFLAHWCPVCDQELPTLRNVVDAGGVPDGVDMILVTTGLDPGRPNWPPKRWLDNAGLGGVTTVRDDVGDPMMRAYGLRAYPAWAVIDAEGTVVARRQGLLPAVGVAQLLDLAAR